MHRLPEKQLLIIHTLSAVFLFILLSPPKINFLILFLIFGSITGIFTHCLISRHDKKHDKAVCPAAAAAGIIICLICSFLFYRSWFPSIRMKSLIGTFVPDFEFGLRSISVLLAVLATPFTVRTVTYILSVISEICKKVFGKIPVLPALIKSLLGIFAGIFISAIAGTILLYIVFLLPIDRIDKNVKESALIIREEGTYPKLSKRFTSQLDNFTDSVILLEAADHTKDSVINRALKVYHGQITGKNPAKTLVRHYLRGKKFSYKSEYSRYWHGYLIFIKPLLEIMSYKYLRIVNGLFQVLLAGYTCILFYRKNMAAYICPYIITYGMLMPIALAKSIQFSSCFYIFTISSIVLLSINRESLLRRSKWEFLFIGISTSFFDFLTYPISTFAIPAIIYLSLTDTQVFRKKMTGLVRNGIFWSAGYGGMWVSKWIIGSLITGNDVTANALYNLKYRTASTGYRGVEVNAFSVMKMNYNAFFKTPVTILLSIYILCILLKICRNRNGFDLSDITKKFVPYLILASAPVVWYAFAQNHSAVHFWFTNKACSVSVLAVCFGLASIYTDIKSGLTKTEAMGKGVDLTQAKNCLECF